MAANNYFGFTHGGTQYRGRGRGGPRGRFMRGRGRGMGPRWMPPPFFRRFGMPPPYVFAVQQNINDRHIMTKHNAIYPKEAELSAAQTIVSHCEEALKLVADYIAESDLPRMKNEIVTVKNEKGEEEVKEKKPQRPLKAVMRVGVLAKGLLLHTDLNMQLVLLCSEKPTRTLLMRVAVQLPIQLAVVTNGEIKYEVKMCAEEAAVIVMAEGESKTSCTITLTSPKVREEVLAEAAADEKTTVAANEPRDLLDKQKCLGALAALRHAKWFQAVPSKNKAIVVVIRILRDLCQRVPTFSCLNQWAIELIVEKCGNSGRPMQTPGNILRRVFETLASGILLPGGPGISDPCEKEDTDATTALTEQEQEDITASAQHALRLIAFWKIYKVLGIDPVKPPGKPPRKRKSSGSVQTADKKEKTGTTNGTSGTGASAGTTTTTTTTTTTQKKVVNTSAARRNYQQQSYKTSYTQNPSNYMVPASSNSYNAGQQQNYGTAGYGNMNTGYNQQHQMGGGGGFNQQQMGGGGGYSQGYGQQQQQGYGQQGSYAGGMQNSGGSYTDFTQNPQYGSYGGQQQQQQQQNSGYGQQQGSTGYSNYGGAHNYAQTGNYGQGSGEFQIYQ